MINREEAFVLLKKYLKEPGSIKYSLAVEAVLREVAKILYRDEELWSLTGLLHNIDYEYTRGELEKRGTLSAQLLEDLLPENGVNAIKANNYTHTDYIPTTSLDKSLIATDAICRLIIATALSTPSKQLSEVDLNMLISKYKDPSFASKISRHRIELCIDLGIELKSFLTLSLVTIKSISDKLDL
jgi:predicted hydrolase (HD superfamily)